MSKMLAVLALTGLFAAGSFTAVALAQKEKPADTKPADPKKEDPKKADPKAGTKGTISIKPDAKGRYRLLVKDADGKSLLMTAGNGFETEKEAKEAIETIKGILANGKVMVESADEKGKDK